MEAIMNFIQATGFYQIATGDWKVLIMMIIAFVLLYLAIVKKFEPLLLLPIAFGMLITNLPGAEMYHEILFAGGHVNWEIFGGQPITQEFMNHLGELGVSEAVQGTVSVGQTISVGLLDVLYLGVKLGIYPCLIFMGVGAGTDFGPLIANPKTLLLGAAAQLGIFMTYAGCRLSGLFNAAEASSIGIIGGADGPTAIFVTSRLAPHLLGPIAVAAYSYMALVPVIQPPIMRALTSKEERQIVMRPLRQVSKREKILFPIVVTVFVALLVPSAGPLIACLMLGNLFKESGVVERLNKTAQNELMNIVTIFLGISVGATAVLIPERELDVERDVVEKIRRARLAGTTHYMVVVAEGAGSAIEISQRIHDELGIDPRVTVLGHIQRGGSPSAKDRETASCMGYNAVQAIAEHRGNCVVATQDGRLTVMEMEEALKMKKTFHMERYQILESLINNNCGLV